MTSEKFGVGAAVLLRALEPVDGIALMERRRGTASVRDLARGPGRLTQALGVVMADDGADLCAPGSLWLARPAGSGREVGASVRIGLTKAAAEVLRFYERENPFVSGVRRLSP